MKRGTMNKEQFLIYIDHFNNKRYDSVTGYFDPNVTVEYYSNWANPLSPARTLHGTQEFINSYKLLHEHVREALEVGDFMSNDKLMFVELYTEFHCIKDHLNFSFKPLKNGEVLIMTNWVMYNMENEKMKRIRIAHFRTHDSRLARL
jgi:hypothetical protein